MVRQLTGALRRPCPHPSIDWQGIPPPPTPGTPRRARSQPALPSNHAAAAARDKIGLRGSRTLQRREGVSRAHSVVVFPLQGGPPTLRSTALMQRQLPLLSHGPPLPPPLLPFAAYSLFLPSLRIVSHPSGRRTYLRHTTAGDAQP